MDKLVPYAHYLDLLLVPVVMGLCKLAYNGWISFRGLKKKADDLEEARARRVDEKAETNYRNLEKQVEDLRAEVEDLRHRLEIAEEQRRLEAIATNVQQMRAEGAEAQLRQLQESYSRALTDLAHFKRAAADNEALAKKYASEIKRLEAQLAEAAKRIHELKGGNE